MEGHRDLRAVLGFDDHSHSQQLRLVHASRRTAILHECRTRVQHQRGKFGNEVRLV